MDRPPRWKYDKIQDGAGAVRLFSWKYFSDFVYQQMLDYESYIWRGQRCDNWELTSTLDRMIKRSKVANTKRWDFAKDHLEQFKYAIRGRRGKNPPRIKSENDWWALGQHHGLATPLIDWTTSPFVAAYFSFSEKREMQTRQRAIYALHKPSIEKAAIKRKNKKDVANKEELKNMESGKRKINMLKYHMLQQPTKLEFEFIRPMSDENQRLVNQGGLFSKSPIGESVESWVRNNFKDQEDGYVLMKILVPNKDREVCLRMLNRMNINHLTLFPDLFGASKFCNTFAEINNY